MKSAPFLIAVFCTALFARGIEAQLTPELTRGPYLQGLLTASVEIVWVTDLPSLGSVEYRKRGGAKRIASEPTAGLEHRVLLTELDAEKLYFYDVYDGARNLTDGLAYHFRTAPVTGTGSIVLAALGDSGTGGEDQLDIAEVMRTLDPHLFLHTGDMTYTFAPDVIFDPYQETLATSSFIPSRGNHDIHLEWDRLFFPPNPDPLRLENSFTSYYSFDWGPAHFTVMDTNRGLIPQARQVAWLEEDLDSARARNVPWLVALFHHPPYSVGAYHDSGTGLREVIVPILDRFEVDLVLCGHDHNYQTSYPTRSAEVHDAWQDPEFISPQGTVYVVTGGGGQILYGEITSSDHRFNRIFRALHHVVEVTIDPNTLSVRALDRTGDSFDSFLIKKGEKPDLEFLRGDVDYSGSIEINDPVALLNFLFLGGRIDCPAVGDANASQAMPNLGDAIYLLNFLFLGGVWPQPPYPECGEAPGADDTFCKRSGCEVGEG